MASVVRPPGHAINLITAWSVSQSTPTVTRTVEELDITCLIGLDKWTRSFIIACTQPRSPAVLPLLLLHHGRHNDSNTFALFADIKDPIRIHRTVYDIMSLATVPCEIFDGG